MRRAQESCLAEMRMDIGSWIYTTWKARRFFILGYGLCKLPVDRGPAVLLAHRSMWNALLVIPALQRRPDALGKPVDLL